MLSSETSWYWLICDSRTSCLAARNTPPWLKLVSNT
jgi:hypothetical protein